MSDSLGDILNKKKYRQPDEITYIKNFVEQKFNEVPSVRITEKNILITVSSAPLAGALRFHLYEIERDLKLKKRLRIIIN